MGVKMKVLSVVGLYNNLHLPKADFQDALEQILVQLDKGGIPFSYRENSRIMGWSVKGTARIDGDDIVVEIKFKTKEDEKLYKEFTLSTNFAFSKMNNHVIVKHILPNSKLV